MFQIDNASSVSSQPATVTPGTPGYFTDGNPLTGSPPTIVPADFMNQVQEELMNIVRGASLTPSKTTNSQLLNAICSGKTSYAADTGTANNYVAAVQNGGSSPDAGIVLGDGVGFKIKIANTNTAASVLNFNSLGNKAITLNGSPLTGGEMVAGQFITLQYDATNSAWQITSATSPKATIFTGSANTTGAANVQVLATVTPLGYSLVYGDIVNFTAGFSNTGAATLNVSSTGAITIKKSSGTGLVDVAVGDIVSTTSYSIYYNGTFYVLQSSSFSTSGLLVAANNLSDLTNAATARTNLGLDTMATQSAGAIAVTGGSMAGVAINGGSISTTNITGGTLSGNNITSATIDGASTGSTQSAGTNNTTLATTAFVQSYVPLDTPLGVGSKCPAYHTGSYNAGDTFSGSSLVAYFSDGSTPLTITLSGTWKAQTNGFGNHIVDFQRIA